MEHINPFPSSDAFSGPNNYTLRYDVTPTPTQGVERPGTAPATAIPGEGSLPLEGGNCSVTDVQFFEGINDPASVTGAVDETDREQASFFESKEEPCGPEERDELVVDADTPTDNAILRRVQDRASLSAVWADHANQDEAVAYAMAMSVDAEPSTGSAPLLGASTTGMAPVPASAKINPETGPSTSDWNSSYSSGETVYSFTKKYVQHYGEDDNNASTHHYRLKNNGTKTFGENQKNFDNGVESVTRDHYKTTFEVFFFRDFYNRHTYFNDKIIGNDRDNVINGADYWLGDSKYPVNDIIFGGAGNDTIYGHAGDDKLSGDEGDDLIYGGVGDDLIYGGKGNDVLFAGSGADTLYGGSGDDVLFSGSRNGVTTLNGGSGRDLFVIEDFDETVGNTVTVNLDDLRAGEEKGLMDTKYWNVGSSIVTSIPVVGEYASYSEYGAKTLFNLISGSNSSKPVTYDIKDNSPKAVYVEDFNPLEDSILIGINPHVPGTPTITYPEGVTADVAFEFKDGAGNLVAQVTYDSYRKWMNEHMLTQADEETGDFEAAFQRYMYSTMRIVTIEDGKATCRMKGHVKDEEDDKDDSDDEFGIEVAIDDPKAFEGLADGKYVLWGAYQGIVSSGTSSPDIVFGTDFADVLYGYGTTNAGTGNATDNDTLYGYGGNDILDGGAGNNSLFGGDGLDMSSYATADGGVFVDFRDVKTSDYGDVVRAGHVYNDPDTEEPQSGVDRLYEIEGIIGSEYADEIYGDANDNYFVGGGGDDTIRGREGNDTIFGGVGDDSIDGGNGDDEIYGGEGNDTIDGGNGADHIEGGEGNDSIFGRAGNDKILGGKGDDTIDGGKGDDTIEGGKGDDKIYGGKGNDILRGGDGHDTIHGGEGDDLIHGGNGRDVLYGDAGNDTLKGGDGNDTITGGSGDNVIYGGNGDDLIIVNGAGQDTIYGGAGADTIQIRHTATIMDFSREDGDTIQISHYGVNGNITKSESTGKSGMKMFIEYDDDGATVRLEEDNGYTHYTMEAVRVEGVTEETFSKADISWLY